MPEKSPVYPRWLKEVTRQGLFRAGQRVGVAVSGGADSVLLLHFLKEAAPRWGITLGVVHFNHRLRGAESDQDEEFVRQLASAVGVDFISGNADVARYAHERKRNLEAAARELRYRFFFSLVNRGRFDLVVTAHTANDQAETVLLRLLRGAGTRGLSGIFPVLEGKVARPFIDVTRDEVMGEIEKRKLEYRVDSTNLDTRLRRNKIRMELLPLLQKEFNPAIIRLLKTSADRARDEEDFLEQQARASSRPWRLRQDNEEMISERALETLPAAIQRRVLRQMLESVRRDLRGMTYPCLEELLHFATHAQSGRVFPLPQGAVARKEFGWLILSMKPISEAERGYAYAVEAPCEVQIVALGATFRFKIIEPQGVPQAYNMSCALDWQKLRHSLLLRNWQAGDQIFPLGSRKPRKLKELFQERKIPWSKRKLWPVLVCEEQVVWVKGFPPAEAVAVSSESREILVIEEA